MKRLANLGIKIEDVSEKDRMFSFAGALRYYGHSSEVRSKCINVIASSDSADFPTNIEDLYEALIRLAQSQNPTVDGTPHIKDPVTLHCLLRA